MVTKSAAGTLVLPVGNPYTGGTQISAGQVTLNNAYGLGNGPITLGGGTVLRVQPNGVGGFGGNGTAAPVGRSTATTTAATRHSFPTMS